MKRVVLAAMLLGLWAASAQAQAQAQAQEKPTWSVEMGTGVRPIFTSPSRDRYVQLADWGQGIELNGACYPVLDITAVLRSHRKTEHCLSVGASWCHHRLTQYPLFGTDPAGKPRYDMEKGTPAGWTDSACSFSVTYQWRHIWNPDRPVNLYSGLGVGLVSADRVFAFPSFTPVGLRFGGRHLYGFAECTVGSLATVLHGGLGWRF